MIVFMMAAASAQTCSNECVDDIGDFAVSRSDIIGVDRSGAYLEVEGGWPDAVYSLVHPYAAGVRFSELEGSPDSTEWGCGILDVYGYVGNVACWGVDTDDDDKNEPPPITDPGGGAQWQSDAPYAEIDISEDAGCAIGATGTVLAWSRYTDPELEDDRPTVAGYSQCSADDNMMCAVGLPNGGVDCWGDTAKHDIPAPTSGTYVDVSCRTHRYCWAVKDDGSIEFFGDDLLQNWINRTPTATNLVEVHTNNEMGAAAVARDSDGYVWAWQNNNSMDVVVDQVPMAPGAYSQSDLVRRSTVKFSDIKIEGKNVCGLVSEDYSGQIECGDGTTPTVDFSEGDLLCWGTNSGTCAEVVAGSCAP